jgi:hypothetical protein
LLETIELRELRRRDDDDDNDADDEDEVEKHAIEIMAPLPLLEIRGENDEACGWSSTYLTGTITIAALLLLLHNEIILAAQTLSSHLLLPLLLRRWMAYDLLLPLLLRRWMAYALRLHLQLVFGLQATGFFAAGVCS